MKLGREYIKDSVSQQESQPVGTLLPELQTELHHLILTVLEKLPPAQGRKPCWQSHLPTVHQHTCSPVTSPQL